MNYTIINIRHYRSEACVVRGVKKSDLKKFKKTHSIYAGSNGSYVASGNQAHTDIMVRDENDKLFSIDAIEELKEITDDRRFTDKFISQLNTNLGGKVFNVEENENFKACLYDFLKKNI